MCRFNCIHKVLAKDLEEHERTCVDRREEFPTQSIAGRYN